MFHCHLDSCLVSSTELVNSTDYKIYNDSLLNYNFIHSMKTLFHDSKKQFH